MQVSCTLDIMPSYEAPARSAHRSPYDQHCKNEITEFMNAKTRQLGTQLSFSLYGAANRMMRLHKPLLDPLGLTFPQYLVILELLDSAPVPVGILGARLGMDTGTITPLVKRLEGAGMLTRTRDLSDERRVMVDLTQRGRAIESQIREVTDQIKTACRMTDQDMEQLRLTLEALGHSAPG